MRLAVSAILAVIITAGALANANSSTPSSVVAFPNIASNFNTSEWLVAPWEPNPASGYPAFRLFCNFSHLDYSDPIVRPGDSNFRHLHMFFGNTQANANSDYRSLRTTGGSTCDGGPLNRTSYWMPAVFDGNNNVVVPSRFELYYKAENARDVSKIIPKPNGLRMIAGAPDTRVFSWKCNGIVSNSVPDCPTGSRLTVSVRFPYCWNGRDLDSADHRSHMAYGTNNTWGPCPTSHPFHLPELTEFAHFDNVSGTKSWYLSSDRDSVATGTENFSQVANGSTMHADWFGAWDNDTQNRWVTKCLKGNLSVSNGNLCDGQQLKEAPRYSGPNRLSGWTPKPQGSTVSTTNPATTSPPSTTQPTTTTTITTTTTRPTTTSTTTRPTTTTTLPPTQPPIEVNPTETKEILAMAKMLKDHDLEKVRLLSWEDPVLKARVYFKKTSFLYVAADISANIDNSGKYQITSVSWKLSFFPIP